MLASSAPFFTLSQRGYLRPGAAFMTTKPYVALTELVAQSASGEFVCVAKPIEIHVFLQHGRVAWATDSSSQFAFRRWLLEHTSLTREVFHEVLESCRRDRLPIGETLVEWRVATREDIKNALRFQISGALASLESADDGQTIFLERVREFASYDARLTFELAELVSPPARESAIVQGSGILDRLANEIPEASWLELLEGDMTIGQLPPASEPRVDHALALSSVMDGAELVAFRSARGTMVGVALSAHRSAWCRLDPEVAFAGAMATICSAATVDIKTTPPLGFDPSETTYRPLYLAGEKEHPRSVGTLQAFLGQAPEVLGAILAEQGETVAVAIRRPWEPRTVTGIVRRRAPLLEVNLSTTAADVALGYRLRSVVTAERNLWCFGAELGNPRRQTLWLVLDRGTAQGLGWAYLASLARQFAGHPSVEMLAPKEWTKTA